MRTTGDCKSETQAAGDKADVPNCRSPGFGVARANGAHLKRFWASAAQASGSLNGAAPEAPADVAASIGTPSAAEAGATMYGK